MTIRGREAMKDQNEDRKTLAEYAKPSLQGAQPSITRPPIKVNFTIPTQILTMIQTSVQFDGLPDEDPNAHVSLFLELCDTFKIDGVTDEAIKLRLFPFSLRGRAKSWLNSLLPDSIKTWDDMAEKFLFRYFPPSKTARLRNNIHAFFQDDEESLYEAWERFKELLRKCPHHGLELWQQVQTFYNGLNAPTRQTLDTTAGGSFSTKTPDEAIVLLEELAMNNYGWPTTRSRALTHRRVVHQVDSNNDLAAHVEALSAKIDRLQKNNFHGCDICGGAHVSADCEHGEQVDTRFIQADPQNKFYGRGNHLNFVGKSNANTVNPPEFNKQSHFQPKHKNLLHVAEAGSSAQQEKKQSLEDMMAHLLAMNDTLHKENHNRFKEHDHEIRGQKAVILNIERQLEHIVSSLTERQQERQPKQQQEEESKRTSEGNYNE